jgi:hypothetical protein
MLYLFMLRGKPCTSAARPIREDSTPQNLCFFVHRPVLLLLLRLMLRLLLLLLLLLLKHQMLRMLLLNIHGRHRLHVLLRIA